jgi:simple sugar transport system permease protein
MAVPTLERRVSEQSSTAPKLSAWIRKLATSVSRPLFAVLLAIIAGGIVIMITSPGSTTDRFTAVVNAYQSLYAGSFGDPQSFSFTLVKVGPLILTGLSVAIAFRAGLFNIGAEGQLAMGAMTAGIIAFKAPMLPSWLLIPLMILGSMLAGAVWGGIVGFLKAWRGAHEVVTTIMLNWTAFYLTDYLIAEPFRAPEQANQTPPLPTQATLPLVSVFYNQTLGTFLPKIDSPTAYFVDVSIFFALFVLVIYWFITSRTTFGYEIRVIGQNLKAAKYAGISIKRNIFGVMALSGAFSGLAGALHLMGQSPYQLIGTVFSADSTGFDAIGVALLGHTTAIGVLFGSLLFGGLRQGSNFMQLNSNVPADLVFIIQALILFSIAAEFLPALQRALRKWLRVNRRAVLVSPSAGAVVAVPINGKGAEQNSELDNESEEGTSTTSTSSTRSSSDWVEEN